jgi:dipeptidyl aminopeptidase/acylaminoacyl peptidase
MKVRLLHGEHDRRVPFEISSKLEALLSDAGYDVKLIPFDDGHVVRTELTVKTILDVIHIESGNDKRYISQ